MKNLSKWLLLFVAILISGFLAFYFYQKKNDIDKKFVVNPRQPINQIFTTYQLNWWTNQDSLKVDDFKVSVIESKLNLFNGKSLISYSVAGHIGYRKRWIPYISEVHLSERLNKDTSLPVDCIIEITPIVSVGENENKQGGRVLFNFTNEQIVNSIHWGENRIQFVCLNKQQIITLEQNK